MARAGLVRTEPDAVHVARMVRAGAWLTVAGCAAFLVYYGLTPEGPARGWLTALSIASLVATLLLMAVPVERLMWRRSFEPFLVAWSTVLVIDVIAAALIDGGVGSPLTLALFLPLVFAAMGYRLASALVVGALVELAYLAAALLADGSPLGEAFFFAATLAIAAGVCAWQARNQERQRDELSRLSRSDPLTGCLNRRGFEECFEAAISNARRSRSPLTLVLLDLDDFKEVNDTMGHAAGDRLLCWVAEALIDAGRAEDAAGRLGGDEFAVLLPNDTATPNQAMDRLRAVLGSHASACFGAATHPADGETLDELYRAADVRLYRAKSARERRRVAGADDQPGLVGGSRAREDGSAPHAVVASTR